MLQPSTNRDFKLFEHTVRIESDLISEIIVKEELELVLNQRGLDLEDDLRRNAAESSFQEFPHVREAISSVDVTNPSHDAPISFTKGHRIASALPVEISDSTDSQKPCQSLVRLEFKLG